MAGDQSHADLIISYLQEQNVENIDYMIASHYDEDHIGGLVPCIDNFSVSNIFGPDYVHTSNLFNNFYEYCHCKCNYRTVSFCR